MRLGVGRRVVNAEIAVGALRIFCIFNVLGYSPRGNEMVQER